MEVQEMCNLVIDAFKKSDWDTATCWLETARSLWGSNYDVERLYLDLLVCNAFWADAGKQMEKMLGLFKANESRFPTLLEQVVADALCTRNVSAMERGHSAVFQADLPSSYLGNIDWSKVFHHLTDKGKQELLDVAIQNATASGDAAMECRLYLYSLDKYSDTMKGKEFHCLKRAFSICVTTEDIKVALQILKVLLQRMENSETNLENALSSLATALQLCMKSDQVWEMGFELIENLWQLISTVPLDLDVSCLYKPSKAFEQFVTLEKLEKSKREHTLLEMLKTLCFLKTGIDYLKLVYCRDLLSNSFHHRSQHEMVSLVYCPAPSDVNALKGILGKKRKRKDQSDDMSTDTTTDSVVYDDRHIRRLQLCQHKLQETCAAYRIASKDEKFGQLPDFLKKPFGYFKSTVSVYLNPIWLELLCLDICLFKNHFAEGKMLATNIKLLLEQEDGSSDGDSLQKKKDPFPWAHPLSDAIVKELLRRVQMQQASCLLALKEFVPARKVIIKVLTSLRNFEDIVSGGLKRRLDSNIACTRTPHLYFFPDSLDTFITVALDMLVPCYENELAENNCDLSLCRLITLYQHEWPRCKCYVQEILTYIWNKHEFEFSSFFQYIGTVDLIEEFMALINRGTTQLKLSPGQVLGGRGTRGTKNKDKDFLGDKIVKHISEIVLEDKAMAEVFGNFLRDEAKRLAL
eukprot:m.131334 g.131334  ORF g.131334 m.131334 type:complete len:691 (+) comp14625_c0_seq3:365-2437(+)